MKEIGSSISVKNTSSSEENSKNEAKSDFLQEINSSFQGTATFEGSYFRTIQDAVLFASRTIANQPDHHNVEYGFEFWPTSQGIRMGKLMQGSENAATGPYVDTDGSLDSGSEFSTQPGGHSHPVAGFDARLFSWLDFINLFYSQPVTIYGPDGRQASYRIASLYDAATQQTYLAYLKAEARPPFVDRATGQVRENEIPVIRDWIDTAVANEILTIRYLGDLADDGRIEDPSFKIQLGVGNGHRHVDVTR
jgi:hypothetical protein